VRRLAERPPELAAEMRTRKSGRRREVVDPERVGVTGVGEVLRTEEVADGWNDDHGDQNVRP
jgi:hypothetical protein